jgi:hypothetical protein
MWQKMKNGKENVRLMFVQNKKGERFQPIFSDTGELVKHYRGKEVQNRLIQVPFGSTATLYAPGCARLCAESGRNQPDFEKEADRITEQLL